MTQPHRYIDPGRSSFVCRMKKSIYGLRQAPRAWYEKFTSQLVDLGFKISVSNPSLFIHYANGCLTYLLLYVDDIIITGNNSSTISTFIKHLGHHFDMKDLGPLTYFLGIEAYRHGNGLFLSQTKYVTDLLTKTDMIGCKPIASPASNIKLGPLDGLPHADPLLTEALWVLYNISPLLGLILLFR